MLQGITRFVVLLAIVFLASCTDPAPPVQDPRAVVVESPLPLAHSMIDAYAGAVRARVEADLAFRVSGKIVSRAIDVGTQVRRGAVLAVLDPQDARLNLAAAEAALAAAEADLWIAQSEHKRSVELRARGFISESAVDKEKSTAMLARARRDQARAELDLARNQSQYTELKADTAGVVTAVMAEVGNVVGAGQPVARVAADGGREVLIQVPEGRAPALRAARHISVVLYADATKRYAGKIREISPQADAQTRTQAVRVTIVGADAAVQLGATATVYVGGSAESDSFRVPATALGSTEAHQAVVWRVEAARDGGLSAQPVAVEIREYLDDAVIVAGELQTSDRLISAGVNLLVPGMAITPVDRTAKATL
ncbi:MAG: efflux RND transporter periplasmic adaptor subunit [Porticoccaceae bacterium]